MKIVQKMSVSFVAALAVFVALACISSTAIAKTANDNKVGDGQCTAQRSTKSGNSQASIEPTELSYSLAGVSIAVNESNSACDDGCKRVSECVKASNGKKNWYECAKETGLPKNCTCAGGAY
jgi:hypothetical protein